MFRVNEVTETRRLTEDRSAVDVSNFLIAEAVPCRQFGRSEAVARTDKARPGPRFRGDDAGGQGRRPSGRRAVQVAAELLADHVAVSHTRNDRGGVNSS